MYSIKTVSNLEEAKRVWEMFLIPNIIGVLSEGEKIKFRENIEATINNPHAAFLYIEDTEGLVIGAIGAWENYLANGGYIIEHFAVREDKRKNGIGNLLFQEAVNFIKQFNPRYISLETGDIPFYDNARNIYEKNGFKEVSHFPEYYDPTCGRIDYMKLIK